MKRDSSPQVAAPTPARAPKVRRGRLVLMSAVALAVILLGHQLGRELPGLVARIDGLGPWGPVAFIAIYALSVVAFVPGSVLTLAGGALFGLVEGVAYVFVAALLGSSLAFGVARTAGRAMVERRLAGQPRFAAIDRAIAERGRQVVFLLRLSPAFPFSLLNYALGLTKVSFVDYALASVGMLPGTLLYVYYGKVAGDVASLAGGATVSRGPGYYFLLVLGLAATVVVTTLVTRLARRALASATGAGAAPPA